jgi:para-aminobenzoate synthetase/4-amino-4-deoxychorismate lyase
MRADVGDGQLLRATFPPGSVTGAPKLRALDEIAEVEAGPRGAYTGAIGFAAPAWGAEFSVAIRTFELADGRLELGVGGGITADSVPVLEWQECLHKAAPLLASIGATLAPELAVPAPIPDGWQLAGGLLETILVRDDRPVRLAEHQARLDRSCRELYGRPAPDLRSRILVAAAGQRAALRVVLAADGAVEIRCAPLGPPPTSGRLRTVRGRSGSWRHKWADRDRLTSDESEGAPLYLAEDDAVLETSRGNVFLVPAGGVLVTPPLREDLLPGVTRRAVLDLARDRGWRVELRDVPLDELLSCAAFWTSSLSGAVIIGSVDGTALPRRDAFVRELAKTLFVS